jgi:hypothetical protein
MTTNAEQPAALLPYTERAIQWAIAQGPALLSVLLILGLGWLALRLARTATARLIRASKIDVLAEHLSIPQRLYDLGFHGGFEAFAQRAVTLIGQLIILHMLLDSLGLHGLSTLAMRALDHLPQLAAGAAIFAAGIFVGDLLRRLLVKPGEPDALVPSAVYYLTLTICAAMALEQVGLDVSLVHTIILLIAACGALVMALTAILSGRDTSRNLVAARYAATMLRVGDHIRDAHGTGEVVAFDELHLVIRDLHDPTHERLVPYHALLTHPLTILAPVGPRGADVGGTSVVDH